jgi:hypothetical protein
MKKAILLFLLSAYSVFGDDMPECILRAQHDFSIKVSEFGAMDFKRGEQFTAKLYSSYARVKIGRIWYQVSRNDVAPSGVDPSQPSVQ